MHRTPHLQFNQFNHRNKSKKAKKDNLKSSKNAHQRLKNKHHTNLEAEMAKLAAKLPAQKHHSSSANNLQLQLWAVKILYLKIPFFSTTIGMALVCFAICAEAANTENEKICTDMSLDVLNKPRDMKMVAVKSSRKHEIVPSTCQITTTKQQLDICKKDKARLLEAQKSSEGIRRKIYDLAIKERDMLGDNIDNKIENNMRREKWSPSQISTYSEVVRTLGIIQLDFCHSKHAKKQRGGSCVEYSGLVLEELLKKNIELGIDQKIQKVYVALPGNAVNHNSLLLGSNLNDVEIINDRDKVMDYLMHAKGVVCDRWNRGSYLNISEDTSNIYYPSNDNFPWVTLQIETVSLRKFSEVNKLPPGVKEIFCENLAELGLFSGSKGKCLTYYQKQSKNKNQEETKKRPLKIEV